MDVQSNKSKIKKFLLCFSSILEVLFIFNIQSLEELSSTYRQGNMQLGHTIDITDRYQVIHGTRQNTL